MVLDRHRGRILQQVRQFIDANVVINIDANVVINVERRHPGAERAEESFHEIQRTRMAVFIQNVQQTSATCAMHDHA